MASAVGWQIESVWGLYFLAGVISGRRRLEWDALPFCPRWFLGLFLIRLVLLGIV